MSESSATQQQVTENNPSNRPRKPKRSNERFRLVSAMLANPKFMSNIADAIDRASVATPKVNHPNPRSLAAALATYPDLLHSYAPDWSTDQQLSFETIVNRSVAVYEIANSLNVNVGTIEY